MKTLRNILIALATIAVVIGGLFFYYVYTPLPAPPRLPGKFSQTTLSLPLSADNQHQRHFSWYRPDNIDPHPALVFVLHGSMGTANHIRTSSAYEFDLLAEKKGYIVVYPQGYENHWNDCRQSADYAANTDNIDDVYFFKEMIEYFVKRQHIDTNKVFVTGHSNGGHMAYKLALEVPELFSAVAPISANLPVDNNLDCMKSNKPISIAIFNGTNDPINPYIGGTVSILGNTSRGQVLSADATIEYWKKLAGITQTATLVNHPEMDGDNETSIVEQRWLSTEGISMRLYTLRGSGHVIPSQRLKYPKLMGGNAGDISGPQEIINFFFDSISTSGG
ncbi:MAG: prolyl oligopeptidase family serine peptidase [Spongiibacteraceae bacterium]